jgi:hypothetical protein
MKHRLMVPVWFFVGILLAIYGVLICAAGLVEWRMPSSTVLSEAHAPVWWGGLMALVGVAYSVIFRPRRLKG